MTDKTSANTRRKVRRERRKKSGGTGIPAWIKIMIIPVLLFLSVVTGAIVGYSVLGDGSAGDVFDLKTWKHMYDLIFTPG